MGHTLPGIQHLYTHISDQMRTDLKKALQRRWEQALDQRIALSPRSPLPLLDTLMAERRAKTDKIGSQNRAPTREADLRGSEIRL